MSRPTGYAHCVTGRREPDLETLVRIAQSLGTSPNWLLGEDGAPAARNGLIDRLTMAGQAMTDAELTTTVVQAEAVARVAKGS